MNFALSTIIVIFLLLPGAVAIKAYYSSLRSKASNSFVPFSELLLQGILISIAIHASAICYITKIRSKEISFTFLYNLILGKDEKEFVFNNKEFANNFLNFCYYILLCTIISYIFVKICKYIIHALKLDMQYHFLRNANHWFLLFNKDYFINSKINNKKQEIDLIMVDVFVKPDIIYSGILIDFNYSPIKDELENLVLFLAKRRKILNNEKIDNTPHVTSPIEIPGDFLVLYMSDIININIRYLQLQEKTKESNIENISKKDVAIQP